MTQENKRYVVGNQFTRAWIDLEELPGGMMHSSKVGLFGPVPASTSCWITTSEKEAERMRADGPVLEIFTQRPPDESMVDNVGDFQPMTPARAEAIAATAEQKYGETIQAAVQLAFENQNDADRNSFLDYWCDGIPDFLQASWRTNVSELLDTLNANEKLQAAWNAWKAALATTRKSRE